jgi:hypothetical protein
MRLAVQVLVPTFTCVCRIGEFAFVPAIEKLTVTFTEPFEDFAVLRINSTFGLDGLADADRALAFAAPINDDIPTARAIQM